MLSYSAEYVKFPNNTFLQLHHRHLPFTDTEVMLSVKYNCFPYGRISDETEHALFFPFLSYQTCIFVCSHNLTAGPEFGLHLALVVCGVSIIQGNL